MNREGIDNHEKHGEHELDREQAVQKVIELMRRHEITLPEIEFAMSRPLSFENDFATDEEDATGPETASPPGKNIGEVERSIDAEAGEWAKRLREHEVCLVGKFDEGWTQEQPGIDAFNENRATQRPSFAEFKTLHLTPIDTVYSDSNISPYGNRLSAAAQYLAQKFTEGPKQLTDVLILSKRDENAQDSCLCYATRMSAATSLDGRGMGRDPMYMYGELPSDLATQLSRRVTEHPELIAKVFEESFSWLTQGRWIEREPAQHLAITGIYADINNSTEPNVDLSNMRPNLIPLGM